MLYLLWGLLNIGLFIFFIFICVRATKLIREKLGLFASFIFVFGLLSFVGRSNANIGNRGPNSNETKIWNFNTEDRLEKNSTSSIYLDLEKTLTSRYELSIKYGQDKHSKRNIPISAYSATTGFVSGTNWKPVIIIVNTTEDNNKFSYWVDGTIEWRLMGARLYFQPKSYKGFALIK